MTHTAVPTRRRFLCSLSAGAASALAPWPGSRVLARQVPQASPGSAPPRFVGFAASADGEAFWTEVRGHFSLDPQLTFLNNGTLGPTPDVVLDTREYYSRLLAADPTDCFRTKELAAVRAQLASFINARPEETCIAHSTTEGMNVFATASTGTRATR
jgi:selenocysteine lyase/cysteine desulfurase